MKIIDCTWEIDNIGSKVIEIDVEKGDILNEKVFREISPDYNYVVVKVPVNMTEFNWCLGNMGFTMIETQVKLSKKIKDLDLNDRYIKRLLPYVSYRLIETNEQIDEVIDRISPTMFLTDRITLDPAYGSEIGCHRYRNYLKTSYENKNNEIIAIYFKDILVGFQMYNVNDKICYGKLGGLFDDVNIPGLGFLVVCTPLIYTAENYGVEKFIPDISTNNMPVVGLYEYMHFHIEGLSYVFVKHQ